MPVKPPPIQTPIANKDGTINFEWARWLQDLVSIPFVNQRTIAAVYTVTPQDSIIFVSGGTFTLTFSVSAPVAGKVWKVFNYGAGTMTFAASSGAVKGLASIGANAGAIVMCDGLNLMVFN